MMRKIYRNMIQLLMSIIFVVNLHSQSGWINQLNGKSDNLVAVTYIDVNTIIATGWGGIIYKTTNAGVTWTRDSIGTGSAPINGVTFFNVDSGIAILNAGFLLQTFDAGKT
jgi:photosystem II stability/assembly factor-like uncharacterized protein